MGLTGIENLVFGTHMAEFHSGYMLYSGDLLRKVPYKKLQNNYNFDAEMIILAHLAGMRCAELPIPTRYDEEVSSLNPIPYGLNVLKMVGRFCLGHYHDLMREAARDDSRKTAPQPAARERLENVRLYGGIAGLALGLTMVYALIKQLLGRRD
jgi:hypothetical protein